MNMMQKFSLFAVIACVVIGTVSGQIFCTLETNLTTATGAWQIDKFPDVGKNCTWRLSVTNTTQNTLQFSGLNLNASLVQLLVTNGSDGVIANLTDSNGIEVVISLSDVTKVVLMRNNVAGTVTGNISANYNTAACSFTQTGSRGLIKSPLYGNQPNRTFTCSVAVTKAQDTDLFVLSFTGFNVPNGSLSVTLGTDAPKIYNGANLPDDILGNSTQDSFSLSLTINTNVTGQNFSLLYQTANSDCSGAKNAATVTSQLVLPATNQFPIECYIQLSAPTGNQVFTEWNSRNGTQLGALDSLIFYDGLSRRAPILGSLNSAVRQFVSFSTGMTVVGELGMQARVATISYRADPVSKVVAVKKGAVQTVTLDATKTPTQPALLQFNGDGEMLSINVTGILANKASVVTVQNSQGKEVYSFKAGMTLFPVTVLDKTARVYGMLAGTDTANIGVDAVDADCNMVYTHMTGQVLVTAAPIAGSTSCSIAFVPALSFMTQLSLSVNLCANGSITVYDGFSAGAKILATIRENGPVPQIWGPSGLRLVYSQQTNCTNQIVSASYQSLAAISACGNLSAAGLLTTPNNPNQYPLNANCNWALPARVNSSMYITVNSPVQFMNTHSLTLQNLTKTLAVFNANTTNPIPDIVVPNMNLSVAFNSVPAGSGLDMTGSGANITVRVIECGASLATASGVVTNGGSNQNMECIWVIQVAKGNSTNPNIISANLSMTGNTSADNTLTVRDGASGRNGNYLPLLNRTILSRTNFLWVSYSYTAKNNTRPLNFTLSFSTFVCLKVCKNSVCMHPDWTCNGINDCGDWSDELNCSMIPVPPTPPPSPAPHTDDTKKSTAGWYIFCIVVGLLLGVMLTVFVPRCIRYVRGRPTSSSRSGYSNMAEDA